MIWNSKIELMRYKRSRHPLFELCITIVLKVVMVAGLFLFPLYRNLLHDLVKEIFGYQKYHVFRFHSKKIKAEG